MFLDELNRNVHVGVERVTLKRGFRFVDLMMESDAGTAISAVKGAEIRGCKVRVELARPRQR